MQLLRISLGLLVLAVAPAAFAADVSPPPAALATPDPVIVRRYTTFWDLMNKPDPAQDTRVAAAKTAYEKQKADGWHPAWLDPATLKSRADYEKMSSSALAADAFSTGLFAKLNLMQNRADSLNGVVMMEVFHTGYSVLDERPDYWLGIASLYRSQADKAVNAKTDNNRMDAMFTLQSMRSLYFYPLYRERLKGREAALLESQLVALRVFRDYANVAAMNPASTNWGVAATDNLVFPMIAMMQRVAPAQTADLNPIFSKYPANNPPTPAQAAAYLDAVIRAGENALASVSAAKVASASPTQSVNSPNASLTPSPTPPAPASSNR